MTLIHAFVMVLMNLLFSILVICFSIFLILSPIIVLTLIITKLAKYISEKKRAKHKNERDKESYNFNKTDILLYDRDKVTLEDCITMKEKYGLSAIIDSGKLLGFISE